MKKKELANLAQRIAKAEQTVENSSNLDEVQRAKNEIMLLTRNVKNLDDMMAIDEMVLKILESQNKGE